MRRILLVSGLALLAAGCGTSHHERITYNQPGPAGPPGIQGPAGEPGADAPVALGPVDRWTTYREFNFQPTEATIQTAERDKVSEIATFLTRNPSFEVGIDGSMEAFKYSKRDRDLSDRRADSVRDALIDAGVPASKIQVGVFSAPERRQEGQIQVLIKTRT
jgi:outer membrane protein OmpA-like peptidoglycan-associated protein